jgi:hypothetical protein
MFPMIHTSKIKHTDLSGKKFELFLYFGGKLEDLNINNFMLLCALLFHNDGQEIQILYKSIYIMIYLTQPLLNRICDVECFSLEPIPFFPMNRQPPWGPRPPHFSRLHDHTLFRHTTLGRTPLDEWSARRRELYLTTHNNHNRQTSMT